MKILHICPRYSPANGGAEDYITTLASWNAKNKKNEVEVWTSDALEVDALWFPGKKKIDIYEEKIKGVLVKRFKTTPFLMNNIFINKAVRYLLVHAPIQFLRILGTPPTCFDMWMQIFRKDLPKYDVVHVDCMPYYSLLYIARAIAKKTGAKLYFTSFTHLGTGKNDPLRKKYFDKLAIQFYLSADKVFVQTDAEKKAIIKFIRENGKTVNEDQFEKVGIGIYPEKIKGGDGKRFRMKYNIKDPIICSIGAKNFVKGHFTLVKAMEILWKSGVKVKLAMGGNHSVEFDNFWEKQSEIVKSNTINMNIPTDSEKLDMLDASCAMVLTSKSESFGIVYLEAWAYKKPVITADIDIMDEIISEGEDGYTVEFNNAKMLAQKIKYLIDNPQIRESMGKSGYNKVMNNYTWNEKFEILKKYF